MNGSCSRRPALVMTVALAAAVALAGAGCLDDEMDPNDPGSGGGFLAFESDFQAFQSWMNVEVGTAEVVGGHAVGPRVVYMNQPPSGSEFLVGSILVKVAKLDASVPATWQIHARVKRGGGVNPQGAINWEWFDLRIRNNAVGINWRGSAPPKDHGYESLPGLGTTTSTDGNCNTCHGLARDADFILSPAIQAMLVE